MVRKSLFIAALTGASLTAIAPAAQAGPDEYIGEIITVGFNFCPRGTMEADGRLLPIQQHTALFSLLGTYYGGDGRTSFALPDLRGRVVVGTGQGPGLSTRTVGERGGIEHHSTSVPVMVDDGAGGGMGNSTTGENMPPFLAMKQCVVTQGIYPSRN
ncbi:phage tail protein [Henriciella pelagia]|jgi:microcystin-dependent protein|uniref:Microcystin dependent MdpB family protein n=1 Tax=Henriciella pelagia TaxID=1977912 RepID=A0ABQ1JRG6_9PROT|nr:tail fiber protein [Henriciella pelagia]GGB74955.1 microcystin dependent MdpB family protein [Henriciella pelagia]